LDFISGSIPDSTDRITISDLASFTAPIRHYGTSPGHPDFDSRWDLQPGPGILTTWINVNDIAAMTSGTTGYPPMFNGERAFGAPGPA
jgi:hypothetical protein